MLTLTSVFVTTNALLSFFGVSTLSNKIRSVCFERVEEDGSFTQLLSFPIEMAAEKIAAISNKVMSYTLVTNGFTDQIVVRFRA